MVENDIYNVHGPVYPINGLALQAKNPIRGNDPQIPSWHLSDVPNPLDPFDFRAVRDRMKELGVTQAMLAQEMGLNQSAISNLLKGARGVRAHEAAFIHRRLGMETPPSIDLVPVIGIASAGGWREAVEMPRKHLPVPVGMSGKDGFAVELSGDSMDELIQPGAYIVIDPSQTQLYNDRVYLIANGEHEATVKLYRSNPARFEPRSSNELHETIFVGDEPVRVIGRVVWQGTPL